MAFARELGAAFFAAARSNSQPLAKFPKSSALLLIGDTVDGRSPAPLGN